MVRAFAVAAFLVAQAGSVLHLGLSPHEICEAHGELVDVRADVRTDVHATPDGTPAPTDPEQHDDCPLLLHNRHALSAQTTQLAIPLLLAELAPRRHMEEAGAIRSIAILDVAPKTSPPV